MSEWGLDVSVLGTGAHFTVDPTTRTLSIGVSLGFVEHVGIGIDFSPRGINPSVTLGVNAGFRVKAMGTGFDVTALDTSVKVGVTFSDQGVVGDIHTDFEMVSGQFSYLNKTVGFDVYDVSGGLTIDDSQLEWGDFYLDKFEVFDTDYAGIEASTEDAQKKEDETAPDAQPEPEGENGPADKDGGGMSDCASKGGSDENLWLIDLYAPFGGGEYILKELRENVFKDQKVKSLQPAPDGSGMAVVEW